MSILLAAAIAITGPVQHAPPPPVVLHQREAGPHAVRVDRPQQQQLARWIMRPVFCDGSATPSGTVQAVVREPDPQRFLTWTRLEPHRTLTLEFRIDASGRPLSIRKRTMSEADYVPNAQDIMPALAASRFVAGAERTGCVATFVVDAGAIADAAVADLMAYTMFPGGAPPRAIWDRIIPAGSTCNNPAPDVLLRAYPAFRAMPDQPGYTTWSMTGYDVDRSGKPRNVRTLAGTNTPALDRASREAVAKSRFEPGARVGCFYPYYKNGTTLAPPPAPEEDAMRPAGATCPAERNWDRPPVLIYPAAYRRRSIEGWAIVTYDVASWGQTGNVRVVKAEPSADFGDAAAAMIRNATFKNGGSGFVGCVDRVLYVIRKPGAPVSPGGAEAAVD